MSSKPSSLILGKSSFKMFFPSLNKTQTVATITIIVCCSVISGYFPCKNFSKGSTNPPTAAPKVNNILKLKPNLFLTLLYKLAEKSIPCSCIVFKVSFKLSVKINVL